MINSPEIIRQIEAAPLLRDIPRELLAPVLLKSRLVTLQAGEKLLSPGKINEQVYIVLAGRLSVQTTPSLSDQPIAVLAPGDCVGEMSVLVDGMVSAYVIAATACELFSIDYAQFWALIDGSSKAARNMLNILVHRIRLGNEVMADNLLHRDSFTGKEYFDNLTGLYNHHGMHDKFDRLFRRSRTGNQPLCLIVLQVDEPENTGENNLEELAGNQSLRTIAQTMLTFLRPDDHAARLIGKKFAVLLTNTLLADACATAERLRTAIGRVPIVMANGVTLAPISVSAGASEALPEDSWNTLLDRASKELEGAGRNPAASTG